MISQGEEEKGEDNRNSAAVGDSWRPPVCQLGATATRLMSGGDPFSLLRNERLALAQRFSNIKRKPLNPDVHICLIGFDGTLPHYASFWPATCLFRDVSADAMQTRLF